MTETESILTSILDCRRVDLIANPKALSLEQQSRFDLMRQRRADGEPLQYVMGTCDFMGIPLLVDKRALIPRPETEILAELAIEKVQIVLKSSRQNGNHSLKILDLGTGSGNIAIVLAKNFPAAEITAVDLSAGALALAETNARNNGVNCRISFLCREMAEFLEEATGRGETFDLIISNPPYIPTAKLTELPAEVRWEPTMALNGGEDGLDFYRAIIPKVGRALNRKSFLILEIGDGQREQIETIFQRCPEFGGVNFHKDYVGTDRIVAARLKRKDL